MKNNLILKKYNTTPINGTFNLIEEKSFFGSKMIEIEDYISIDDKSIQYYQYWLDPSIYTGSTYTENLKKNGFQNYIKNEQEEILFIQDLVQLKYNNHTIKEQQQDKAEHLNNTKWEMSIDVRNIITQYILYRIKEVRTFRGINYNNFINNNINVSITDYIVNNIIDRYKFDKIDFYVKYDEININSSIYSYKTLLQYSPDYDSSIKLVVNKVANVNVENPDVNTISTIKLKYNQTKPSTDYKFDYYFDLYFKKI